MMQNCPLGSNTGLDNLTEQSVQLEHYCAVELQVIPFVQYKRHTDHDSPLASSIPALFRGRIETTQMMLYALLGANTDFETQTNQSVPSGNDNPI